MNSTLEILNRRKSVRAYSSQPVTDEEKDLILKAAFRAPTAGNMMLYAIIEVQDQSLKDRLAETCDHQPFIARAPYVLLFLADYQRWYDYFNYCGVEPRSRELALPYRTPQVGDLLLTCCDTLIAAQTAVIAAESLGIGSCYIGDILEQYEIHRELFNLPPYTLPITLVCFGHPASLGEPANPAPRFDRKYIVHKNTYRRFNSEEMEDMFRVTRERYYANGKYPGGAQNVGQAYFFRKFVSGFSIEMTRSVKEMLKNWE
ncbi:MAG: nitroreductase family protein [Omnitrophica WOR_2 bacterium]